MNHSYSQNDLTSLYAKTSPAVGYIKVYNKNNELISTGSGFFIDKNGIGISCAHVFLNGSRAEVQTLDRTTYFIKSFEKLSVESDLAVFKIELPDSKMVSALTCDYLLANRAIGQEVFTIGNPFGYESTLSNGIISSLREVENYGKIIQTTVPISAGSSGSPLLNKLGKVIGVITFTILDGQNLNFAIDISQINMLPDYNMLEFPKDKLIDLPYSYKDFERAEIGLAKEMIKARERYSDYDEVNTYLSETVSSVHDNYTSYLCYEGTTISNIVANICYEFKHNYLVQIKFESQGFIKGETITQVDFSSTLKEFIALLNMLEILYGVARNEASINYCEGCYLGDVSIFKSYSLDLENQFKKNKLLVVVRFNNIKSNNQINLICSYSGIAEQYPFKEQGLWWLTISKAD